MSIGGDVGAVAADGTASALYVALGRLVREIRRSGGSTPVGPSAMSALVTLHRAEHGLRLGELAEAEGISAPSLTRIVHSLEDLGLVTRSADPRDARCQVVAVTPGGAELIGSGTETRIRFLSQRMSELSHEHQALLRQALPAFEALAAAQPING